MLLKRVGYEPHRFFWKFIWKLKILPKIWVFAWRIGHSLLPTNTNLSSIKSYVDPVCSRCRNEDEMLIHALRDYPKARAVLIAGGFDNRLLTNLYDFCIDWVEDSMRILDKKTFEDFITTLWNIWNGRNNIIFRGKEEDAYGIWERSRKLNIDFRIHNLSSQPILPRVPRYCRWEKPSDGIIKVNVDAAVNSCGTSLGIIARDSDSFVLNGRAFFTNKVVNPEWAGLDALIDSFWLAHFLNVDRVIFELNCASIVNHFSGHKEDITILAYRIKVARSCLTLLYSPRSNGLTRV
ncbi:hypothetical protein V6Z11_A02G135500 [Gossypium hirsutum]